MTGTARCAKLIRKELKDAFPNTKFTVRSSTFSMGDSVDIGYTLEDEHSPSPEAVEKVCRKYQAGYFNGMEDIYEYRETGTEESAKYVFVQADWTPIKEKFTQAFLNYWDIPEFTDQAVSQKLNCWADQGLIKYIKEHVFPKLA